MTVRTAGVAEKRRLLFAITALAVSLLLPSILQGQATISTGNINGTVVDPSGAAVPGAKITITHIDTDVTTNLTTNSSGFYNSGSIAPGKYLVKVEAKGFETAEEQVNVRIANNTAVNFSSEDWSGIHHRQGGCIGSDGQYRDDLGGRRAYRQPDR